MKPTWQVVKEGKEIIIEKKIKEITAIENIVKKGSGNGIITVPAVWIGKKVRVELVD